MKRAYCYIHYKFYKFFETIPLRWSSEWKAEGLLMVLEIWLLISILVYYKVFNKSDLIDREFERPIGIVVVIILVFVKYFVFEKNKRWLAYVKEFDALPKSKNRLGTLIVGLIVFLIITNTIFSFYLMSQIDWSLYR